MSRAAARVSFVSMKIRSRSFAGMVTLLAFLVATAETVWAGVCSPEMGGSSSVSAAQAPSAHDPGCPMEDTGALPSPGSSDPGPDVPHCPFLPLGSAGSCVPTLLPARSVAWAELPTRREVLPPRTDVAPDLLLVAPPFHPPKA